MNWPKACPEINVTVLCSFPRYTLHIENKSKRNAKYKSKQTRPEKIQAWRFKNIESEHDKGEDLKNGNVT